MDKKEKGKILIILPQLTAGGTERTAAELANYIAKQGYKVSLLLMFKREIFYRLHPNVKLIEPKNFRDQYGKFLSFPILLWFLRKQIVKEKPTVVFALGYILLTLFTTLGLTTKVVISGRSSPTRVRFPKSKLLNKLYKLGHRLLSSRVNGIIAQTNYAREVYQKKYACLIHVIPNFLRQIKEHQLDRKDQVITVGRCVFEKGQEYLIEAFSKLNAPGWTLMIVGDGPKRQELEVMASRLEIADKVIFTGFQKDVDLFLAQSKIFALTSVIEGYPNALIEAMANGLAPVSFDCIAGPSDIIEDGINGFLVPVGDVDILTNNIKHLIEDESLRKAMALKATEVKETNKLEKIAQSYLDFFQIVSKDY